MKHLIEHATHYSYTAAVAHSIQILRLTPRTDDHQRSLRWQIDAPGTLERQTDPYGNITHILTIGQPRSDIELRVTGLVEIDPLREGLLGREDCRLPVQAYCVQTPLTLADGSIIDFARSVLPRGIRQAADILALANAIRDRVLYEPGITDVTTAASEVLEMGHGVCQDHAHLFLACTRGLGVPARYVSGYLLHATDDHAATHAWADVWLADAGWTSVDVTHGQFASGHHCRLAVARDYDSASPVRGVRSGGGEESMTATVSVQAVQSAQA